MLKRSYHTGNYYEAGIDEAGRGCLAGPVTAAVVILQPKKTFGWYKALNDSKVLSPEKRNELRTCIERDALGWAVGFADHHEIDSINILRATYLAMHRAIEKLQQKPGLLVIDGNRFRPYEGMEHVCVVKGDGIYLHIAAASILAKTHRDELMQQLHAEYPFYGWDRNKAYATLFHREAIDMHGLSPYHRRSFRSADLQLEMDLDEFAINNEL